MTIGCGSWTTPQPAIEMGVFGLGVSGIVSPGTVEPRAVSLARRAKRSSSAMKLGFAPWSFHAVVSNLSE